MGKREDILKATESVVREYGLAGVTVARVLEAADAGYGTMYHYFPSLDDLLDTYFSQITDEMTAFVLGGVTDSTPPRDALEAIVEGHLEYCIANYEKVISIEQYYFRKFRATGDAKAFGPVVAALESTIARGQAAGVFRQGNPTELRQAVFGLAFAVAKGVETGVYTRSCDMRERCGQMCLAALAAPDVSES